MLIRYKYCFVEIKKVFQPIYILFEIIFQIIVDYFINNWKYCTKLILLIKFI